jgi:hypothetical protein
MQCKIIVLSSALPAPTSGLRFVEHDEVGVAVHGSADCDALALAPDKLATVDSSDADASEADHVDENLLQDLLWRLMSIRGTQFMQLGIWMESVCLRLSKGYNVGQVDPLGFLGPCSFRGETPPRFDGLYITRLEAGKLVSRAFFPGV